MIHVPVKIKIFIICLLAIICFSTGFWAGKSIYNNSNSNKSDPSAISRAAGDNAAIKEQADRGLDDNKRSQSAIEDSIGSTERLRQSVSSDTELFNRLDQTTTNIGQILDSVEGRK